MQKPSNAVTQSITTEIQAIMRAAAEPVRAGETVKIQIHRAARRLQLAPRRAETFWYGTCRAILADEADRLRFWHREWLAAQRARLIADLARLDDEQERLAQRLAGARNGT